MEEWKSILDYPDYEISNLGNVRRNGKILNPRKRGRKNAIYHCIAIYHNKERFDKSIHRLVAEAFIPNPDNKPDVDHIDRNRTNNVVTNLRWTTKSENMLNRTCRDRELFGIYKHGNNFQVQITINQKKINIGSRKTLEEAIILRDDTLNTLDNNYL